MLNRFRSSSRGKGASLVVWALLGLLIIGLTGLGLGGAVSSLSSQNVASVDGQNVSRQDYVRTLLRQLDQLGQRSGQRLTVSQARQYGLDREVLRQMVTLAALDGRMDEMGVSVGDAIVAKRLRQSQAFQGLDGKFSRDAYDYYLKRNNMTASEYENKLRADIARTLLELSVSTGVAMPEVMAQSALAFDKEQRRFRAVSLTTDDLAQPVGDPTDEEVQAWYDAHHDAYTTPETRVVTYAALRPADLIDTADIPEKRLRDTYEARKDSYSKPERRAVDVIAFSDEEAAQKARDRIDSGEITYAKLAEERGLSDKDISLGQVTRDQLGADAREAVFGAEGPGVVGPVQSDLGPALYRINAVMAASTRSFEDVREELRKELATEDADGQIADRISPVRDLIAGGATIEEIGKETPLQVGEIGLTDTPGEGLAGDTAFREEAMALEPGDPPRDLIDLDDGGIAVLRVDRVDPPKLQPLDEVRGRVVADWTVATRRARLRDQAEALKAKLDEGRTLDAVAEEAGLSIGSFGPVTRGATLDKDLPPSLLPAVFGLDKGGSAVVGDGDRVLLAQLDEVIAADPTAPEQADALKRLQQSVNAALGQDLYQAYAQMVTEAGNPTVNQSLVDSTLAQYP